MHNSDEEEQLWVWEYETEEGTHDLFMDINEEIRFRVIDETFTDMTPAGPENISKDKQPNQEAESKKLPYVITVSTMDGRSFQMDLIRQTWLPVGTKIKVIITSSLTHFY